MLPSPEGHVTEGRHRPISLHQETDHRKRRSFLALRVGQYVGGSDFCICDGAV
jgi:hypothetical protein